MTVGLAHVALLVLSLLVDPGGSPPPPSVAVGVPSTFAHQTNRASAAVDDVRPALYCHVTNIVGAADDHVPGCFIHVVNAPSGTVVDTALPNKFVYFTNVSGGADSPFPATYIHVTNFAGSTPTGCTVNLLLEFNTACNIVADPVALH